jgi:hypothetical protein
MRFMLRQAIAPAFAIVVAASTSVFAQPLADDRAPATPTVLTGKERLGRKWMDEQRIDNCKVPIDKRGLKLRPDICLHGPTG